MAVSCFSFGVGVLFDPAIKMIMMKNRFIKNKQDLYLYKMSMV